MKFTTNWGLLSMHRMRTWKWLNMLLAILLPLSSGCQTGVSRWWYLGEEKPEQEHYREVVSEIDYPDVASPTPEGIESSAPPRTIVSTEKDEIWDLTLQEAIHLALANNEIIRNTAQFLSPGNGLLANPLNVNSIYDPAIQASGVLFGGVGTEAALADFDATWTTSMFWGKNETIQNSPFGGGLSGTALSQDTANFNTALNKQFAYGAQFTLSHQMNYQASNSQAVLFPSVYTGNVQAEYRQQLLAGSGPDFVRVAGPLSSAFTSITGVGNGVLIARINQDISITNFEESIRNLVKDVEDTYWDLYLSYRTFDTAVTARNAALHTWRNAENKKRIGGTRGFTLQDEAQSRDRYFETRAEAETTLGDLYVTEQRMRSLMGIAVNDRKIIRPADSPVAARIHADWYHSLAEALTERVELRRQKWNIKSLELQLGAAKNFARPRLDFIARYRVNGFGDKLLAYDDTDEFGGDLNSAYERITQGDETGWDLGLEYSMPIGLRLAKTQVRNLELRLAKARKVLAAQELEIGHELAVSFQELEKSYATAVSNYSRRQAAMDRYRIESALLEGGSGSVDLNLRAQESLATATNAYHRSLVDYNKAIVNLYFRKGTLLQEDSIHLVEGRWEPEAYKQAYERSKARANGIPAPHLKTIPAPFAADGHVKEVGFAGPEAAGMTSQEALNQKVELAPYPDELPLPSPLDDKLKDPQSGSEGAIQDVPAVPAEKGAPEAYFETQPGSDLGVPQLKPMSKPEKSAQAEGVPLSQSSSSPFGSDKTEWGTVEENPQASGVTQMGLQSRGDDSSGPEFPIQQTSGVQSLSAPNGSSWEWKPELGNQPQQMSGPAVISANHEEKQEGTELVPQPSSKKKALEIGGVIPKYR